MVCLAWSNQTHLVMPNAALSPISIFAMVKKERKKSAHSIRAKKTAHVSFYGILLF